MLAILCCHTIDWDIFLRYWCLSQIYYYYYYYDMETSTLVIELRRGAIKRWVPCDDMDRRLEIPHSRAMPIR